MKIVYQDLSYKITGLCFQAQKELGRFCREKQYADNLEELIKKSDIQYKREYQLTDFNQGSPKGNKVDFLIEEKIILDVKAKNFITKDDYFQMQRYLQSANLELGLIVNFRDSHLKPKRVLNSNYSGYSDVSGFGSPSGHSDSNSEHSDRSRGFSLIEVLLSVSIFALLMTFLVGAWLYGQEATALSGDHSRATFLAEEGLEATRNIRDASFVNLSNGNHGLSIVGNQWSFSGTSDATDIFTRQVGISAVDTKRKNITSTVTWPQNLQRTGSVALATRLTNWAATGKGSAPSLIACFNLDVANSSNEAADGISIATQGNYLYLGRQNNNGYELFVFDVTTPSTPTLLGKVVTGDTANDLAVSGNYVYIASSDNPGELTVVDITTPTAPTVATKFDLTAANSGNANADALAVLVGQNNDLYLTRANSSGKEFYVFNISSPTAPILSGSADLNGDLKEMGRIGNYIYGASSDNTQEFQVIDISNPSSPSLVASLDLNQGATQPDALSIATGNNIVYLGRDGSAAPEFYIIDVTNPLSPTIKNTLDIGTHILQSIDFDPNFNFVFFANTAPGAEDYQVIDVSDPLNPSLLSNLNLNGTPYKLVYSTAKDSVMIASGYDACELQIISP